MSQAVQVNAVHPKFGCALKDIRACTISLTLPLYHIEADGSTEVDQPGLAGTMLFRATERGHTQVQLRFFFVVVVVVNRKLV